MYFNVKFSESNKFHYVSIVGIFKTVTEIKMCLQAAIVVYDKLVYNFTILKTTRKA